MPSPYAFPPPQSRSFYARDRRRHEPEAADELGPGAGEDWEGSSNGGASSAGEESDVEEGRQRSGGQRPGPGLGGASSRDGSSGTHSGGSNGGYRPPLVSFAPAERRRPPNDGASMAAAAAAAVAEVEAERRRLAQQAALAADDQHQHGRQSQAEAQQLPTVGEESAEPRQLGKPSSSRSHPSSDSTAHRSINSFEMASGGDPGGSRSQTPPLRSPSPPPAHGPSAAAAVDEATWVEEAGGDGSLGERLRRLAEAVQWPLLMLLQVKPNACLGRTFHPPMPLLPPPGRPLLSLLSTVTCPRFLCGFCPAWELSFLKHFPLNPRCHHTMLPHLTPTLHPRHNLIPPPTHPHRPPSPWWR
jgi:hypothetical protein